MSNIKFAGDYEIKEAILHTSTGNIINLQTMIGQIDIFEDITKTTVTASLVLMDTNNIVMNAPITGNDYVSLKIQTPGLTEEDQIIDFTRTPFFVQSVGLRNEITQGAATIVLTLISGEYIKDQRVRVSKAYTAPISEIAENIIRNDLGSRKNLFIEPTDGTRRYVVPNLHPLDLLKRLAREAISKNNGAAEYFLYENTKGIHFRSLQSLYEAPTFAEFKVGKPSSVNDTTEKRQNVEEDLKRVVSYQINSNNDNVMNMRGGLLGSTLVTHDIYNKEFTKHTRGYFDNFDDHKRISGSAGATDYPIYNDNEIDDDFNTIGDFPDTRLFVSPLDKAFKDNQIDVNSDPNFDDELGKNTYSNRREHASLLHRTAKWSELTSGTQVSMQINGQTPISVGNTILMELPIVGKDHDKDGVDKFLKGKFLITTLRHTFINTTKKHEVHMVVIKDGLAESIEQQFEAKEPLGDLGFTETKFYDNQDEE